MGGERLSRGLREQYDPGPLTPVSRALPDFGAKVRPPGDAHSTSQACESSGPKTATQHFQGPRRAGPPLGAWPSKLNSPNRARGWAGPSPELAGAGTRGGALGLLARLDRRSYSRIPGTVAERARPGSRSRRLPPDRSESSICWIPNDLT